MIIILSILIAMALLTIVLNVGIKDFKNLRKIVEDEELAKSVKKFPSNTEICKQTLEKLNKEKNITVVIVLHELNNACRFADNIIGFKKGKVICEGKPLDVITKENLKKIYGIEANLTISEDGKYPICMEYDLFREA